MEDGFKGCYFFKKLSLGDKLLILFRYRENKTSDKFKRDS